MTYTMLYFAVQPDLGLLYHLLGMAHIHMCNVIGRYFCAMSLVDTSVQCHRYILRCNVIGRYFCAMSLVDTSVQCHRYILRCNVIGRYFCAMSLVDTSVQCHW